MPEEIPIHFPFFAGRLNVWTFLAICLSCPQLIQNAFLEEVILSLGTRKSLRGYIRGVRCLVNDIRCDFTCDSSQYLLHNHSTKVSYFLSSRTATRFMPKTLIITLWTCKIGLSLNPSFVHDFRAIDSWFYRCLSSWRRSRSTWTRQIKYHF